VSILKKGVRFLSQDTNNPLTWDELPFLVDNLTPAGMRRAAVFGVCGMCLKGYSVNEVLEILGDEPKENQ
jgi:hypothetical protein